MQFFGPSASIYCPDAAIICPNATILMNKTYRDCQFPFENDTAYKEYSNMVLNVITFQTKDFLCHLSRTTKHCKLACPRVPRVTLVQAHEALSKVFCSLNTKVQRGGDNL